MFNRPKHTGALQGKPTPGTMQLAKAARGEVTTDSEATLFTSHHALKRASPWTTEVSQLRDTEQGPPAWQFCFNVSRYHTIVTVDRTAASANT